MSEDKPRLTDFATFWKLMVLVCVALIAEGVLLYVATAESALDWTSGEVTHIERGVPLADDTAL